MNDQIELDDMPGARTGMRAILFGAIFWALLYNIFGYGTLFYSGGIDIPILALGYYLCAHITLGKAINYRNHGAWIYFLIIGPISLAHMLYDNDEFLFFNIVLLFFLLLYQTLLAIRPKEDKAFNFFRLFYDMLCDSFLKPFSAWNGVARIGKGLSAGRERSGRRDLHALIGAGVSLIVVVVSGTILYHADVTFKRYMDFIPELNAFEIIGRVVLFALIFFLVLSVLYSFRFKQHKKQYQGATPFLIPSAVILWILIPLTVLYVFFSAIQLSYLFTGYTGETLAYEANSAFTLFVVAAVINYIVFAMSQYMSKAADGGARRLMKWLAVVLLVCTGILLASGMNRLVVYQNAFGYTMRRIMPFMAYIIMSAVLSVTVIGLFVKKLPLFKLIWLIPLFGIMLFNVSCPNGLIARLNIDRTMQTGAALDAEYLGVLSADAIPYVFKAREQGVISEEEFSAILYDERDFGMLNGYFCKADELKQKNRNWQAFNLSKTNAAKLLK